MRKTAMAGGVALMLLATAMMASAYHVPNGPARNWDNPPGFPSGQLVVCEDPSANATVPQGEGGLCYASCEHFETVAEKKEKKDQIQTTWCVIEPKCLGPFDGVNPAACVPGGGLNDIEEKPTENPNPTDLPDPANLPDLEGDGNPDIGGDWFMRAGDNNRACRGEWGQAAVFKQSLLYFGGTTPNDQGISGHATFFINEPNNFGTYNFNKFTVDPTDDVKTEGNCTGNDVGLCDVTAKTGKKIDACGEATEADKKA